MEQTASGYRDLATNYPLTVATFGNWPVRVDVVVTDFGGVSLSLAMQEEVDAQLFEPSLAETTFADNFRETLDNASRYAIELRDRDIASTFRAAASAADKLVDLADIPAF